jgi:hypothetical protein
MCARIVLFVRMEHRRVEWALLYRGIKLGSAGRANCRKQWRAGRIVRVVHIAFYRPLAEPGLKAQVRLGTVMELYKPRRGCKYSHRDIKTGRSI